MEKLFKSETYLISSQAPEAEKTPYGYEVAGYLKRAALKHGFNLVSFGGQATVASINLTEDIPFARMQKAMDDVSAASGLSLFLSNEKDLLGKELIAYPHEQKRSSFLRS